MSDILPPGGPGSGDGPTDGDGSGPGDDESALTYSGIEPIEIQDEMERSFLDYAMSVIVQRALPDARDGLKPGEPKLPCPSTSGIRIDQGWASRTRVS